jgi:hypothetical protein
MLFSNYKTRGLIWLPYVFIYVGFRNDYKGQMRLVNSEFTVISNKQNHLSYTLFLGYINCYYEYKIHNKFSLNANHTKHILLTDTNRRVPFVKPVLWISNNINFLRKASLLCSLAGFLYSYINEFLTTYHSYLLNLYFQFSSS